MSAAIPFPQRSAPEWVQRLARATGLTPGQLRWCASCRLFVFAADDYQRAAADRAGFRDACPDCTRRAGRRAG